MAAGTSPTTSATTAACPRKSTPVFPGWRDRGVTKVRSCCGRRCSSCSAMRRAPGKSVRSDVVVPRRSTASTSSTSPGPQLRRVHREPRGSHLHDLVAQRDSDQRDWKLDDYATPVSRPSSALQPCPTRHRSTWRVSARAAYRVRGARAPRATGSNLVNAGTLAVTMIDTEVTSTLNSSPVSAV